MITSAAFSLLYVVNLPNTPLRSVIIGILLSKYGDGKMPARVSMLTLSRWVSLILSRLYTQIGGMRGF